MLEELSRLDAGNYPRGKAEWNRFGSYSPLLAAGYFNCVKVILMDKEKKRPDPDALLKEVEREEEKKGRLKIFLGYAPGVGKTFAMLNDAHVLKKRGIDVVVGFVETHKRAETEALLSGLDILPRKKLEYRGIALGEMDIDAILARRPQVVLVDELAHTNAEGSRHPKRYQDIEDLLENGIDVHTTVNIQHFESMNDAVAKITGVRMQETLPDTFFDRTDEVQVIDVPWEELTQRLKEGKVYLPKQARHAIDNFFQRGNLFALRELMLTLVARKMDSELLNYMKAKAISGPWPAAEKLVVCIAPKSLCQTVDPQSLHNCQRYSCRMVRSLCFTRRVY